MMSLHRIRAHDRRRVALHEAGHFVVARHLGAVFVEAEIWEYEDDDDLLNVKTWGGQCRNFMLGYRHRGLQTRMIGVAGHIAEMTANAEDIYESDVFDRLSTASGDFSETDLKYMAFDTEKGCDNRLELAITRVTELLRRNGELRSELIYVSRVLIKNGICDLRYGKGNKRMSEVAAGPSPPPSTSATSMTLPSGSSLPSITRNCVPSRGTIWPRQLAFQGMRSITSSSVCRMPRWWQPLTA